MVESLTLSITGETELGSHTLAELSTLMRYAIIRENTGVEQNNDNINLILGDLSSNYFNGDISRAKRIMDYILEHKHIRPLFEPEPEP